MMKEAPMTLAGLTTRKEPMTIEKTIRGAWRISAIIDGQLVSKQYMGYSKKEAVKEFKQGFPLEKNCKAA